MEALRIGGGLAVAVAGWRMLTAPDVQGGDTSGPSGDLNSLMTRAFFPLAVPLTSGPGSIAAGIALHANRTHGVGEYLISGIVSLTVAALVALVMWPV
ncbi:small neutral amino acid transporter SnatA (MarC family) [Burkholderia ambifaria]|nr:small neutral amino acid transporter SnatA (MarC family) [Burkholderia ambifaria]